MISDLTQPPSLPPESTAKRRMVLWIGLLLVLLFMGGFSFISTNDVHYPEASPRMELRVTVVDENKAPVVNAKFTAIDHEGNAAPYLIDELSAGQEIVTGPDGAAIFHRLPVELESSVTMYHYLRQKVDKKYPVSKTVKRFYTLVVSAPGFETLTLQDTLIAAGHAGAAYVETRNVKFADGHVYSVGVWGFGIVLKRTSRP